ncbi:receptor-like protein 7 [Rhododendron vialii]|uniref:receptor-like protein 7 n=1 Tax=Rhododendron vialii TaxID=182163 RepID=UPI002660518D|nr:receptor-like protein 7 [Rhododendron vialii]
MRIPLLSWLFLIPIFAISVSGQCLEEQKSLLLQLKNTLTFTPSISTILTNWTQTLDCCQWNGVTCDRNGRVTGLDLHSESISNGIDRSSPLFSLSHLETLNLAYNSLNSSPIPANIGNLTNLRYLNLSNSGFSGQLPTGLSLLTGLVILDLSALKFFGTPPRLQIENPDLSTLFGNHSGVVELYLDGVNISANGSEWGKAISSSMPNLRVLSLSNCLLSGPIDFSLQSLKKLSKINLSRNNLASPVPDFFANFRNLTVLILISSNLNGTFPGNILQQVHTLETLNLASNELLNGSLPDFPENGSLRELVLSFTGFSGNLPESIGSLMELTRIEIPGCFFRGAIPNSLSTLSQLVYLDFSSNNFSGPIPSFQGSKNLTLLDLSHNALTGEVFPTYFEGLLDLVYIDLSYNSFNGNIPSSLFSLPSLQKILLSNNKFGGQISGFPPNGSLSKLVTLDLCSNILEGPIPSYFFDFLGLKILSLSFNNFSGIVDLKTMQRIQNLSRLELSYNNLSVYASVDISSLSSFPQLNVLRLASCNLRKFPALMNQSRLTHLDLADNQIPGVIPNWIWNVGNRTHAYNSLQHVNLSCNLLVGLQSAYIMPILGVLDLHSNKLQGDIPLPPETAIYVDYSSNNFNTTIPGEIGRGISFANFFSLANNAITGPIPQSICNGSYLQVLDLSNNMLSGSIPQCLIENCTETLGVLNLGNNSLSGNIFGTFPQECVLKTLDLNRNHLEGHVPESLSNCAILEVLNLGSNNIKGNFPCFLKNSSNLHVLVLRSNGFQGGIRCPGLNSTTWPKLQIIDIALNNFSGDLPPEWFLHWNAMMLDGNNPKPDLNHLHYVYLNLNNFYYQDKVTVTVKGLEIELVKILTAFTSVDFSVKWEHSAKIARLTFLSVLNLSYNQLVGRIPQGYQFQTFSSISFDGNKGLCGFPLTDCYKEAKPTLPTLEGRQSYTQEDEINWVYITITLGYIVGFGVIVGPLLYSKRWRQCYYKPVDRVILRILHHREWRARHQRGRDNRNQLHKRQHR